MTHSYFLVTNDESTIPADGDFCGFNNCRSIKHSFTVRSEEAQTVYLSAHTWPLRTYPHSCKMNDDFEYYGAALAKHYFHFTDRNTGTNYPGDDYWYYWNSRISMNPF